jgi:hypothetical protein
MKLTRPEGPPGMKALTKVGHIEHHGADRWPSATGQDVTGPRWTSVELARPEGQTSNFLIDSLADWNAYLEESTDIPTYLLSSATSILPNPPDSGHAVM